ncbi:MAG: hypothetical protein ACOH2H_25415 [Cypionkella sp.]
MIAATNVVGIDVSRDGLDGFVFPDGARFRLENSAEGHANLILMVREKSAPVQVSYEATGGQEWAL